MSYTESNDGLQDDFGTKCMQPKDENAYDGATNRRDETTNDSDAKFKRDKFKRETLLKLYGKMSSERESSASSPEQDSSSSICTPDFSQELTSKLNLHEKLSSSTDNEEASEELHPDLIDRVKNAVEYYLSDYNLSRDAFLLNHVSKHRDGYVSLKLLSKYKKLKRIIKDISIIKIAIKDSQNLEIHEDGTKIRRKTALSSSIDVTIRPFKILLAYKIPEERATIDKLASVFGKFGEVTSLQIHKPTGRSLQEIQILLKEKPELRDSICALVEYEKVNSAHIAFQAFERGEELPIKVLEYHRKTLPKLISDNESSYFSASDFDEPFSPFLRRPVYNRSSSSSILSSPCSSPFSSRMRFTQEPSSDFFEQMSPVSPSNSPWRVTKPALPIPEQRALEGFDLPLGPPFSPGSPFFRRSFHKSKLHVNKDLSTSSTPNSPWVRRRIIKANASGESCPNSPISSPLSKRKLDNKGFFISNTKNNIIRHPYGPDGSIGFKSNFHT